MFAMIGILENRRLMSTSLLTAEEHAFTGAGEAMIGSWLEINIAKSGGAYRITQFSDGTVRGESLRKTGTVQEFSMKSALCDNFTTILVVGSEKRDLIFVNSEINAPAMMSVFTNGGNDTIITCLNNNASGNTLRNPVTNGIDAGNGNDLIIDNSDVTSLYNFFNGGAGNDTMRGNDSAESFSDPSGKNLIFAGGGDDMIYTGSGNDRIYGEAGNDKISAGHGKNYINAGSGDDEIIVTPLDGLALLNGVAFNPGGINTVNGGEGNDTIITLTNPGYNSKPVFGKQVVRNVENHKEETITTDEIMKG